MSGRLKGQALPLMDNPNIFPERHGGKFPTTNCGKRAQACVYGGMMIGLIFYPFTALFTWLFLPYEIFHVTIPAFITTSFVAGKMIEYCTFGLPCHHPCTCSRCSEK
jgi:hypothetical protein